MKKSITSFIFLASLHPFFAQTNHKIADSLGAKGYHYFQEKASEALPDTSRAAVYLKAWVLKATESKDWEEVAVAYKEMAHNTQGGDRMRYADSMIVAALRTGNDEVIGSAYLTKGSFYYALEEHETALSQFILGSKYIARTNDKYLKHKVKFSIALSKMYLGFYEEAVALLRECEAFYENENERAYLNSLHALGIAYNKLGRLQLTTATNMMGTAVAGEIGDTTMLRYFRHSEGVNTYFKKDYTKAIHQLTASQQELDKNQDFIKIAEADFYIGSSYWNLGQKGRSIPFLEKVVRAYIQKKYQRPELRGAFELLINYYKEKEDKDLQLYYVNQLMKVDSMLSKNFKYLSSRMTKEYDHKELVQAKEALEKENGELKGHSKVSTAIIGVLLMGLMFFAYNYIRIRRKYKRRFVTWKNQSKAGIQTNHEIPAVGHTEINPELTAQILAKLERFEKNLKYTAKDMTLQKLATELNFNSKYVSRVILQYRGKKFVDYINDLKIDYVVEMLQKESRWRKYSHRALASEAGLGSPQNFSRLFRNRMKMPPAFFIEELEKDIETNKLA